MSDVIEVEAEAVEVDVQPLGGLLKVIAEMRERSEAVAAQYKATPVDTEDQLAQAKRERSGINAAIKAIDADYKALADPVRNALKDADAARKSAKSSLEAVERAYGEQINAYMDRWRSNRISELREEFEGYAPDLADLVDFDVVVAKYGQGKGAQWDARSMPFPKAADAMRAAVSEIAKDEQTIVTSPYGEEDKAALKADYFRTLDLSGALRRCQQAKEQRERVAELERQRKEREEAAERARKAAEQAQTTIEDAPAPEPKPAAPRTIDTHTQMSAEEYAAEMERMGTPLSPRSALIQHAAIVAGGPKPGETVPSHVFAGYGNQAQAEAFQAFCDRSGIRRRVVLLTHGTNYQLTPRRK